MPNRKILPPSYLYAAIGLMVILHFLVPGAHLFSRPAVWVGIIPLVAGIVLNLLADRAFKQHKTTVKPFEESAALITSGVFNYSRNPMYLGFVVGLAGIALLLGSLIPWIVIPLFMVVIKHQFIRVEEQMLQQQFGQAFLDYKRRTRRWI